jgi:putative SOS response-associated peptidase YedK
MIRCAPIGGPKWVRYPLLLANASSPIGSVPAEQWERLKDRASSQTIQSCTIITTTPNEVCAPIHDRMPVILEPEDYARWLGEEPTEPPHLMMMLKPYPAAAMEVYPVISRVGGVKNADQSSGIR